MKEKSETAIDSATLFYSILKKFSSRNTLIIDTPCSFYVKRNVSIFMVTAYRQSLIVLLECISKVQRLMI